MAEKTKRTRKVEEIVPDAARTVASLRDIGYDTPRAIADLVDNSIAAGATEVDVTFTFLRGASRGFGFRQRRGDGWQRRFRKRCATGRTASMAPTTLGSSDSG